MFVNDQELVRHYPVLELNVMYLKFRKLSFYCG